MGKLLMDDQTLRFYGIDKSDTIVHLFPKPTVVVLAASHDDDVDNNNNHTTANNTSPNAGAHVPQIVLDAQEAERRSQILILSSNEIFEAQHKVRLLSFLLLIICAMELLTLFTILIGVPTDQPNGTNPDGTQHDDLFSPTDPADNADPTQQQQLRTWQNTDYADLAVSSFGFYVATLGIKASTENTARLAKQYFYCLLLAGISWNAYYYMLSLKAQEDRQQAHHRDTDTDDQDYNDDAAPAPDPDPDNPNNGNATGNVYTQALLGILVPMCVWITCFLRAWQFHQLILEAEVEAEQRAIANDDEMNRSVDSDMDTDMDTDTDMMNVDEDEDEEQARGSQSQNTNTDIQSVNTSIRRGDHSPVPYGTADRDLILQNISELLPVARRSEALQPTRESPHNNDTLCIANDVLTSNRVGNNIMSSSACLLWALDNEERNVKSVQVGRSEVK
eukprot:scaffold85281_cov58-Attheya_sp.AAC.1